MECPDSSAPLAAGHASSFQPQQVKPTALAIPESSFGRRNGHANLDTFSPVNANGSFEYDRVVKSGEVWKRTRKTKVCIFLSG
jgi:hypothetical protein